jgi:hypothetical protein
MAGWLLRVSFLNRVTTMEGVRYFHFCSYRHSPNHNDTALKNFSAATPQFHFLAANCVPAIRRSHREIYFFD